MPLKLSVRAGSGAHQAARDRFDLCLIPGLKEEAVATYGTYLRHRLSRSLEIVISPLERRRATKRGFQKMVRSEYAVDKK